MNLLTIRPELLAANIDKGEFKGGAPFLPQPARWREMLWWVEWVSHQPGGLEELAETLLEDMRASEKKAVDRLKRGRDDLARKLHSMCAGSVAGFYQDWPVENFFDFVFHLMERHAAETAGTIAQTEVSKIVFRKLEFSISQNVPVPIVGESRIGKTSPAGVWATMRPGRARLVTVPPSNRERDFITAHADALDIEYTSKTSAHQLRALVQYVLRHSGIFLVYDESQNLVPANYGKSTPPARLNWVRCEVIDRGLGCSFIATPQSYRQTLEQYVKVTGYRMEQWLGRLAPAVILPLDLGKDDMLAVAKVHFPDMPEPFLKLIAADAMASEGYLKNLEITAKCARFIASENGRSKVNLDDVKAAIIEMMPETIAPAPALTNAATPTVRRATAPAAVPTPVPRPPRAIVAAAPPDRRHAGDFEDLSGPRGRYEREPKRANELIETS